MANTMFGFHLQGKSATNSALAYDCLLKLRLDQPSSAIGRPRHRWVRGVIDEVEAQRKRPSWLFNVFKHLSTN